MKNNEVQLNSPASLTVSLDYEGDSLPNKEETIVHSPEQERYLPNEEGIDSQDTHNEELSEEGEKTKPRSKRWEKERRAREEKYLLSQALAEEKKRNLQLREYLNQSVDNNTMSSADRAIKQLEDAELAHAKALEEGDALGVSKASTALVQANLNLERIANTKLYSKDEQKVDYSRINPDAYAAQNIINDWLIDNPEFDEDSEYYNKGLVDRVGPLINKLDAKLKKQGKEHLISSPMYFDVLDSLVSQVKSNGRLPPMAGPVNSRKHERQVISQSRPILTEQQKIVAAGCNMTEEQYANWINKYAKEKTEQESKRNVYGY